MTSMTSPDLTTGDQVAQGSYGSLAIDAASLYRAFEQVKDRRGKKGKRYTLALILTLIMLAKMAGETKIDGMVYWIELRKKELKSLLNWPKEFPSNRTYSRALASCDDKEIAEVFAGVVEKVRAIEKCDSEPSRLVVQRENERKIRHLAADGKTLRGTLDHAHNMMPSVHILTLPHCYTVITIPPYIYTTNTSKKPT